MMSESPRPKSMRQIAAASALALGLAAGGFGIASAASSSTATTPAPAAAQSSTSQYSSNNDPAHEAGESAQRKADEAAGRGFGSNTDPTHEAGESAQRKADEAAGRGFQSNTDPAHEAGESAQRKAEEAANDGAAKATPATGTATTPAGQPPPRSNRRHPSRRGRADRAIADARSVRCQSCRRGSVFSGAGPLTRVERVNVRPTGFLMPEARIESPAGRTPCPLGSRP